VRNADTPGPGSYRPPSDFGYVDSLKFGGSPRDEQMRHTNYSSSQQDLKKKRRVLSIDGAATQANSSVANFE